MDRFVEFEYYENGKKFFINREQVANFETWLAGSVKIAMMPHFDPVDNPEDGAPPVAPFICFVRGTMEEVAAKLNG